MYILIHIRLRGRVSEKKIFPGEFPETIGLLFWPNLKPLSSHTYKKSSSVSSDSFSKPSYLAIHALSFKDVNQKMQTENWNRFNWHFLSKKSHINVLVFLRKLFLWFLFNTRWLCVVFIIYEESLVRKSWNIYIQKQLSRGAMRKGAEVWFQ